jgi:hypothetical protein
MYATMDETTLVALYLAGIGLTFALLVANAETRPGGASEQVVSMRAGMMSLMWPAVLAVGLLAVTIPEIGDWILNGRRKP